MKWNGSAEKRLDEFKLVLAILQTSGNLSLPRTVHDNLRHLTDFQGRDLDCQSWQNGLHCD